MHELLCFNGKVQKVSNAQITAVSQAALYGRGVFTSLAFYNRKPFLWSEHQQRLMANAKKIGLDLAGISAEGLENNLRELIAENKVENGRARLTIFDLSGSGIWRFNDEKNTAVLIITAERQNATKSGLKLTLSPYKINQSSPLTGVKSCNYLENLTTLNDAKNRGFDEALRANFDGNLASACLANVFWVKGNTIFTPQIETGALSGTTRGFILKLAPKIGLEVRESSSSPKILQTADEIFLTSAGLEICPARSFGERIFGDNQSRKLQKSFFDAANSL